MEEEMMVYCQDTGNIIPASQAVTVIEDYSSIRDGVIYVIRTTKYYKENK